jgi:hypothetical protein
VTDGVHILFHFNTVLFYTMQYSTPSMGRSRSYEDVTTVCRRRHMFRVLKKNHSPRDLRIKTGHSFAHAQLNAYLFRNESYSSGDLQCSQQRLGCTAMFIITEVIRRGMSRFQLLTSPNNRISLMLPCKSWRRVPLTRSDYGSILNWTGHPVPRPLPTLQFAQYFFNHALAVDTCKAYSPLAALPPSSERALASSRIDL